MACDDLIRRRMEQQRQWRENSLRRKKLFHEAEAARELALLRLAERRKLQAPITSKPTDTQAEAADDEPADIARRLVERDRDVIALLIAWKRVGAVNAARAFSLNKLEERALLSRDIGRKAVAALKSIEKQAGITLHVYDGTKGQRSGGYLTADGLTIATEHDQRKPVDSARLNCG